MPDLFFRAINSLILFRSTLSLLRMWWFLARAIVWDRTENWESSLSATTLSLIPRAAILCWIRQAAGTRCTRFEKREGKLMEVLNRKYLQISVYGTRRFHSQLNWWMAQDVNQENKHVYPSLKTHKRKIWHLTETWNFMLLNPEGKNMFATI